MRKRRLGLGRFLARSISGTCAVAFAMLAYVNLAIPDVRPFRDANPATTAFMQLRQAEARAEGKTLRPRQHWVRYQEVSPELRQAVLVAEDSRFWQHDGLDVAQIRESIEVNFERWELARGASTITQQLAKNLFLSPSRDPLRKFRELLLTRRLETVLSKRRILEMYLNVIEWGDGIFGVEAAASTYFGIPAAHVGSEQAALLAAAIINPRRLNPARPSQRLLARQRLILGRMHTVRPEG